MNEWPIVLSALGAIVAVGGLVRLFARDIIDHIDKRFTEAETRRQEQSAVWSERLAVRDSRLAELASGLKGAHGEHPQIREQIAAVDRRVDDVLTHVRERYVSRETYLEAEGRTMIKLDKILDRLNKIDPDSSNG